jgi:hypothetical protein
MATLSVQTITRSGIVPSLAAVSAAGDVFPNDGRTFIWITNDHGSASRTLTIVTQGTVDGLSVADRTVDITAANDRKLIGPFDPTVYNNASGQVALTYSDSGADMTIGVFRLAA